MVRVLTSIAVQVAEELVNLMLRSYHLQDDAIRFVLTHSTLHSWYLSCLDQFFWHRASRWVFRGQFPALESYRLFKPCCSSQAEFSCVLFVYCVQHRRLFVAGCQNGRTVVMKDTWTFPSISHLLQSIIQQDSQLKMRESGQGLAPPKAATRQLSPWIIGAINL